MFDVRISSRLGRLEAMRVYLHSQEGVAGSVESCWASSPGPYPTVTTLNQAMPLTRAII